MNVLSAYNKANKVIESCSNLTHIEHTYNYINNFFRMNTQIQYGKKQKKEIRVATAAHAAMYTELLKNLNKKKAEFHLNLDGK